MQDAGANGELIDEVYEHSVNLLPPAMPRDMRLFVPEGWTRGEPLKVVGWGPRYALMQSDLPISTNEAFSPSSIAAIEFNSLEEAKQFNKWWHEHET